MTTTSNSTRNSKKTYVMQYSDTLHRRTIRELEVAHAMLVQALSRMLTEIEDDGATMQKTDHSARLYKQMVETREALYAARAQHIEFLTDCANNDTVEADDVPFVAAKNDDVDNEEEDEEVADATEADENTNVVL